MSVSYTQCLINLWHFYVWAGLCGAVNKRSKPVLHLHSLHTVQVQDGEDDGHEEDDNAADAHAYIKHLGGGGGGGHADYWRKTKTHINNPTQWRSYLGWGWGGTFGNHSVHAHKTLLLRKASTAFAIMKEAEQQKKNEVMRRDEDMRDREIL